MYSGRLVNIVFDDAAGRHLPIHRRVSESLPARESTLPGIGGLLNSRAGDFDLAGREAWVFISIKNRSFNRPYIDRFIDLCDALQLRGHVCPVDDPYRYNRMAELGRDDLPEEEGAKIERLSADIARMVQKAINGKRTRQVDLVRWCDLEAETPPVYRAELSAAFHGRTRIRDILFDHISAVKPIDTERTFERYAEFFLCEVPVLMHGYYGRGPTMDIYPGPQPKFFWQIELGLFSAELPKLTALTRASRSLLYLDTHDRSGARA